MPLFKPTHHAALAVPEAVANDYRKILAFASSAGHTISGADALEVIKSICLERLHGDERAAAIVRHAERVRALLASGGDVTEAELEAFRA